MNILGLATLRGFVARLGRGLVDAIAGCAAAGGVSASGDAGWPGLQPIRVRARRR